MTVLPGLLDQIARRRAPLVLVLDDYQFISDRAAHQTLAFFLDHLPQQMHLVIATRADPLLRSRGFVQVTRWSSYARRICASPPTKPLSFWIG
jgi:hypothetical protein